MQPVGDLVLPGNTFRVLVLSLIFTAFFWLSRSVPCPTKLQKLDRLVIYRMYGLGARDHLFCYVVLHVTVNCVTSNMKASDSSCMGSSWWC